MFRIGVDFGGTKIELAALDESGRFLARRRRPNPGGYDAALGGVQALLAELEAELGSVAAVGVGLPGSPSPVTGLMRNANSTWLNGRPFSADLQRALSRPVRLANDANCLALSEATDGAAAGARVVFGLIIGTGCGGGLVVDGRLVEGANGVAGEVGHTPLPWADETDAPVVDCWCGRRGCLETWVSGPGLSRDYAARTGRLVPAHVIVEAAREGEAHAAAALDRYVDRLGRGLTMVVEMVDPDVLVLGGGLSNVGELYLRLPDAIRARVFADAWSGRLVPARWGDSSGVRGAARLWSAAEVEALSGAAG